MERQKLPADEIDRQLVDLGERIAQEYNTAALVSGSTQLGEEGLREFIGNVRGLMGGGALAPLLDRHDVENIHILGHDNVVLSLANGERVVSSPVAGSEEELVMMIRHLAATAGHTSRRFDTASPILDLRLASGHRLFAVTAVAERTSVVIRRHRLLSASMDSLAEKGTVTPQIIEVLRAAVRPPNPANLLVVGGTGAGKTTLLRSLISEIPQWELLVTIEDTLELHLRSSGLHPRTLALETRTANTEGTGEVTTYDLAKAALRMSPDRVIVGEVRGGEVMQLLQAMGIGNDGSLGTIHAGSTRAAINKMLIYAQRSPDAPTPDSVLREIAEVLHLLVYIKKLPDGRRAVTSIREVTGYEDGKVLTSEVFGPGPNGVAVYTRPFKPDGQALARLLDSGFDPRSLGEPYRLEDVRRDRARRAAQERPVAPQRPAPQHQHAPRPPQQPVRQARPAQPHGQPAPQAPPQPHPQQEGAPAQPPAPAPVAQQPQAPAAPQQSRAPQGRPQPQQPPQQPPVRANAPLQAVPPVAPTAASGSRPGGAAMTAATVIFLGAIAGIGLLTIGLSFQRKSPEHGEGKRLKKFRAKGTRADARKAFADRMLQLVLAVLLGLGGWYATGWIAGGVLGAMAGWVGPLMVQAPRKRHAVTDEIEQYSQWAEQVRDLVGASGSLFEAVTLSAENAPVKLRPAVVNMTALARTVGLPPALDWFAAEMRSPFADRLVLGMKIAWDSGARVTEAFESTARGMRNEVEMRRRNEVANSRAWTQVVAILFVTLISVGFMFIFNQGFFDPFGSTIGQIVLLAVGVLIFGNVFWVLKLSETGVPIRLLAVEGSGDSDASTVPAGTRAQ